MPGCADTALKYQCLTVIIKIRNFGWNALYNRYSVQFSLVMHAYTYVQSMVGSSVKINCN